MTTLTQYTTNLTAKGYDSVTTAVPVTVAINAARREIVSQRPWSFLEIEVASLATVVGNPSVSLAALTDFAHPDSVRLSFGTDQYPIDFLDPQEFKDQQQSDGTVYNSIPRYWTYFAGALQFTPRPDKVYVVTFDYLKLAADLAAGGDVCIIPSLYQDVVGWWAAKHLAFRGRDQAGLTMAESQAQGGLQRMVRADKLRERQTDSRVRDVNC